MYNDKKVLLKLEWLAKIYLYRNHYYYSVFYVSTTLVDFLAALISDGPTS